jgi:hypothetical protein
MEQPPICEPGNLAPFVVADLYTGAFLVAQGCRLMEVVPVQNGRFGFSFLNADGEASRVARSYAAGATVEGVKFASAVHDLKTRIFAARSQTHVGEQNGNTHRAQPHDRRPR